MKLNFRTKKMDGFTLIEVLLATVIIGGIGIILADILSRSFKSDDKIQTISTIKQNGQNALNIISQTIRDSDQIVCPASTTANNKIIVVKRYDQQTNTNIFTRFRICSSSDSCSSQSGSNGNGFISQDFPTPSDPNSSTVLAGLCDPNNQPAPTNLINNDLATGVSIVDGKFDYSSFDPTHKSISIQLNIGPSKANRSSYETQILGNAILFQTTVQQR